MANQAAPFRTTLKQQEQSRTVRAAMTTHQPAILDSARALYQSVLREGETFDWEFFHELNLRLMDEAYVQLDTVDQAHRADKAERAIVRKLLVDKAGEVRRHFRSVRNSFAGAYGDAVLPLLGLDGPIATKPLTLVSQGRFVVIKLRDTTLVLPDPLSENRALDRAAYADELEAALDELDEILARIESELKQIQKSRAERLETLRFFRRRHVNLTRVFEAYLRLLGLDDLADRLRRPAPRRSSGGGEDADDAATDSPASEPASETP